VPGLVSRIFWRKSASDTLRPRKVSTRVLESTCSDNCPTDSDRTMAMRLRLLTLSTALFVLALCFGTIQSAHPRISPTAIPAKSGPAIKSNFVGSETCRKCHEELYQSWKQTRMANVVRDPKKDPQAVLGDFSHPDPNLTFDLSQVAFVYGSRWKQRYFTRRGDDYFVLPA
jgi:hypothetical protein